MIKKDLLRGFPLFTLLLAGLLLIGAIGCGGSGSSGGTTTTATTTTTGGSGTANPYSGTYNGEFIDQNDFIGTASMTVSSSGVVQGTFGYSNPVTFSGMVNTAGVGTVTYSGTTLKITFGASGLTTLGVGIGTSTDGAFMTLATLPSGSAGGVNWYAGTVHNTTLGATGIIALSVTPDGTIQGVDLFDVNGTPTLKGFSGSLSNSNVLAYTVNGVTVTGTVTNNSSTITGNLQESNGDSAVISLTRISS